MPEDEEDPIVSRHLTLVRDSGSGYSVFVSVVGPDTNFRWDKSGGSGAHENYELTYALTESGPLEIIHRQGNGGNNSSSENNMSSSGTGSTSMDEYYDLTWINGVLQNPTGYMRIDSGAGGTSSTSSFPGGFQSQFNSTPGGFGSYTDDIFDMLTDYAGGGLIAPSSNDGWFNNNAEVGERRKTYEDNWTTNGERYYYTEYSDNTWELYVYTGTSPATLVYSDSGPIDSNAGGGLAMEKINNALGDQPNPSAGTAPTPPAPTDATTAVAANTGAPGVPPDENKSKQTQDNVVNTVPEGDPRQPVGGVMTSSQDAEDKADELADNAKKVGSDITDAIASGNADKIPKATVDELIASGQAVEVKDANSSRKAVVVKVTGDDGEEYYIILKRNQKKGWAWNTDQSTYSLVSFTKASYFDNSPTKAAHSRVFDWDDVALKNRQAALLTFLLHVVPGGEASDEFSQGNVGAGTKAAIGDVLMAFAWVAKGAKVAKGVAAATVAYEGTLAAEAGYHGVKNILGGNGIGAAGNAGEVLLRLLGVKMSAAELKALKNVPIAAVDDVAEEAAKKAGKLGGPNGNELASQILNDTCFVAGTPVMTPTGSKPIEELEVGDMILSRPEENAEADVRANRLERRFILTGEVLEVHLGGQTIVTTTEHPFYVVDKGWVPAGDLQLGDNLLGLRNGTVRIEMITRSGRVETVYNLRIEQDHTYFVGSDAWGFAVWVHNAYELEQLANGKFGSSGK